MNTKLSAASIRKAINYTDFCLQSFSPLNISCNLVLDSVENTNGLLCVVLQFHCRALRSLRAEATVLTLGFWTTELTEVGRG